MGYVMKAETFVKKAKDIANNYKTLYILGAFGAPMTSANKKRYTTNYSYNAQPNRKKMIMNASSNTFGFDCVCLIKGILWGWNGNKNATYGGAKYCSNGVPDFGSDGIMNYCTGVSTSFKNIAVGEVVHMKGHVGIYIGNGLVVECSPKWKNKVQITACGNIGEKSGYNTRTWTNHGKLKYIDYSKTTQPTTTPKPAPSTNTFLPKRGYWKYGDSSKEIGKICKFYANKFYGYFCKNKTEAHKLLDGDYFGKNCLKWTKEFQKRCKQEGLYNDKVDGNIGEKTIQCLKHFGFKV